MVYHISWIRLKGVVREYEDMPTIYKWVENTTSLMCDVMCLGYHCVVFTIYLLFLYSIVLYIIDSIITP